MISMVSLGEFPAQVHSNTLLPTPMAQYLQFPSKPHLSFPAPLKFHAARGQMQNGLCCNAVRTKPKRRPSLAEMDGPDELEDDSDDGFLDLDDDDGGDGGIEEESDEICMPLVNIKMWRENMPRGFGKGKTYDTSIENKLMGEIQQSRAAQLANVNRLKITATKLKPSPKKEVNKEVKGLTQIQDEIFRVRLLNLPRKKKIHKDLKIAFEGARGIVSVVPVVSGNEKTRDPVCIGLAFVAFKHLDEAQRFVQNFSGKSITFGKVQKHIRCELVNPKKSNPANEHSVHDGDLTNETTFLSSSIKENIYVASDDSPFDSSEERLRIDVNDDADKEANGSLPAVGVNSSTSSPRRKTSAKEKKITPKRRKDKTPKLNILVSANRLKMREKEMLRGVLSKYGAVVHEHG